MDSTPQSTSIGTQNPTGRLAKGFRRDRISLLLINLVFGFYRMFLGPLLRSMSSPSVGCKFYPTCSHYSQESIQKHGFIKGLLLTVRRILKCHPWSKAASFDPVPQKMKKLVCS